jgi:hypothetical protein
VVRAKGYPSLGLFATPSRVMERWFAPPWSADDLADQLRIHGEVGSMMTSGCDSALESGGYARSLGRDLRRQLDMSSARSCWRGRSVSPVRMIPNRRGATPPSQARKQPTTLIGRVPTSQKPIGRTDLWCRAHAQTGTDRTDVTRHPARAAHTRS